MDSINRNCQNPLCCELARRGPSRPATAKNEDKLPREGDVLDGIMILVVGFGFMFAMWAAVIYGSSFFGPK
jgi:hypothetical protein